MTNYMNLRDQVAQALQHEYPQYTFWLGSIATIKEYGELYEVEHLVEILGDIFPESFDIDPKVGAAVVILKTKDGFAHAAEILEDYKYSFENQIALTQILLTLVEQLEIDRELEGLTESTEPLAYRPTSNFIQLET